MNRYSHPLFTLSIRALPGITLLAFLSAITTPIQAQQPAWSATGTLSTARSLHTATPLANGKVLVVGGINVINPCCANTGNAELYDPATGNPSTPRTTPGR